MTSGEKTELRMSRLKRWSSLNSDRLNADGSFTNNFVARLTKLGYSSDAIAAENHKYRKEYDRLKHLDETDPEPWPIYTAWDVWFTESEKKQFNPDGSLKPEYVQESLRRGLSITYLMEEERKKMEQVERFDRLSEREAAEGRNFGEDEMRSRQTVVREYNQTRKMQELDRKNGEEFSSWAMGADPADYF
jgi:hypothetical protein